MRTLRAAIASLPTHLIAAAFLLVMMLVVGTAGYMIVEGWGFLDSLYMTVITVTTIGFREVDELDDAGQVFTIVLAIGGVGAIFYGLLAVFQFILEGELATLLGAQRMKRQIQNLTDHYILVGFGRVGEEIGREFAARSLDFVIVETNQEAIERAQQHNYLVLIGDATSDAILKEAGVERARCLLAAADSDAGNTFVILTAKALNPDVFVVSRAANPESQPRMLRAGADRVFSPYIAAGRRMALSALQPILVGLVDTTFTAKDAGAVLAEIEISREGALAGRSIAEVLRTSPTTVVLAIQKPNGELAVGPAPAAELAVGDTLILIGREEELESIRPIRGSESRVR